MREGWRDPSRVIRARGGAAAEGPLDADAVLVLSLRGEALARKETSNHVGAALQQRPREHDAPDPEVDDEAGHVHERRDERGGGARGIEAEAAQEEGEH